MSFDQRDGLPSGVFQDRSSPACWRGKTGQLWFTTAGGPFSCQPSEIAVNAVPPKPVVEAVSVDGLPISEGAFPREEVGYNLAALDFRCPTIVRLPPGSHALEIRYAAPSLVAPEKVSFDYKLEGLDHDWVHAGPRKTALYGYLPPGNFLFRVRAGNGESQVNREASLSIIAQPFFWQTSLFRGLLAMALVGSTAFVVLFVQKWRIRRALAEGQLARAREAERVRISRDLHDHLGASLTEVALLAADAAGFARTEQEVKGQLSRIEQKVQGLVVDLESLVWAVEPRNDTLASLVSHLASFVEDYASSVSIACSLEIQSDLPPITVRSEVRHNLFLCLREAVNNSVKHSSAKLLSLHVRMKERCLTLEISDSGEGFEIERAHYGNGIINMKERMHSLGGDCEIRSKPSQGTSVTLQLNL